MDRYSKQVPVLGDEFLLFYVFGKSASLFDMSVYKTKASRQIQSVLSDSPY